MLAPEKPLFVSAEFHIGHKTATKMKLNMATLTIGDITGFETMVSDCQCRHLLPTTFFRQAVGMRLSHQPHILGRRLA